MSKEEQKEIDKAKALGNVEYFGNDLEWIQEPIGDNIAGRYIYRIKPEEVYDFAVTMNGKPVNPKDISKETWMSFRGE